MRPGSRFLVILVALAALALLVWMLLRDRFPASMELDAASTSSPLAPVSPGDPALVGNPSASNDAWPPASSTELREERGVAPQQQRAPANSADSPPETATPSALLTTESTASPGAPGADEAESRFPREWRRCFRQYPPDDQYSVSSDASNAWSGSYSVKIASRVREPSPSGAGLCQVIAAKRFQGQRVRMTLHLRTLEANPGAHMVFRAEGADGQVLAFHNMEPRWVRGTTGWNSYSVVIDVPARANVILAGGSLVNTGAAWLDDAMLEIVDANTPLTQPPIPPGPFNEAVDVAGLATELQNPGFEATAVIPARE